MTRLSAEMGQLMSSLRDFDTDKAWNWMRTKNSYSGAGVHEYLRFEPCGGGMYELYVLNGWHTKASRMHTHTIFGA